MTGGFESFKFVGKCIIMTVGTHDWSVTGRGVRHIRHIRHIGCNRFGRLETFDPAK